MLLLNKQLVSSVLNFCFSVFFFSFFSFFCFFRWCSSCNTNFLFFFLFCSFFFHFASRLRLRFDWFDSLKMMLSSMLLYVQSFIFLPFVCSFCFLFFFFIVLFLHGFPFFFSFYFSSHTKATSTRFVSIIENQTKVERRETVKF